MTVLPIVICSVLLIHSLILIRLSAVVTRISRGDR